MTSHHHSVPASALHRGESLTISSRAQRVWTLSKIDRVVECDIREQVSGYEVRFYLGGELFYGRLDTSAAAAAAQAANLKRALLGDGWIEGG